jgi:hypothetical protein
MMTTDLSVPMTALESNIAATPPTNSYTVDPGDSHAFFQIEIE